MMLRRSLPAIALVILFCDSCSSSRGPRTEEVQQTGAVQQNPTEEDQLGKFDFTIPNRAKVNAPFQITLQLTPKTGCGQKATNEKPASLEVRMGDKPGEIEYKPPTFSAIPCKNNYVTVTVKEKGPGIASLLGIAEGYHNFDESVDVGFDAKVRLTTAAPLGYNQPGTLNVEIVDLDGKPLSFANDLSVTLESADALISADSQWGSHGKLVMLPGARSSPPFQIKSQNRYGGAIHLTTSLLMGSIILSQENHSFDVAPATWLPILSAIIGALLYGAYSIVSDDKRSKILEKVGASVVAGTIAWLFTGFDILGLKLDTHSLRSFAITGFLFAFLGVDVLLSKRFPRTVSAKTE